MNYGCKLSKIDLRDYKIKACAGTILPETFELKFTHHIKNQGNVGSCVAHSTSEILEYYALKEFKTYTKLSTNFIYGIRRKLFKSTGEGMTLVEACKIVKTYGDMTFTDCSGNTEVPLCFSTAETSFADIDKLKTAKTFKIENYFLCPSINAIKTAIINFGPVLAAIKWYDKYTIDESGIINFDKSSDYGYHAVMIYGWNKDGFLTQNSWGTKFGNKGNFIIPYNHSISEARCLVDHDNSNDKNSDSFVIPNSTGITDVAYKAINTILNFIFKR